ncbi:MAG: hypothetical protein V1859_06300 [archaeon]
MNEQSPTSDSWIQKIVLIILVLIFFAGCSPNSSHNNTLVNDYLNAYCEKGINGFDNEVGNSTIIIKIVDFTNYRAAGMQGVIEDYVLNASGRTRNDILHVRLYSQYGGGHPHGTRCDSKTICESYIQNKTQEYLNNNCSCSYSLDELNYSCACQYYTFTESFFMGYSTLSEKLYFEMNESSVGNYLELTFNDDKLIPIKFVDCQ